MRLDQRDGGRIVAQRDHARAAAPRQPCEQHRRQQHEARLHAVEEMIEPAERDEAARLALFLAVVFHVLLRGFLRRLFFGFVLVILLAPQPKPAASASVANAAMPDHDGDDEARGAGQRCPKTHAGTRNSAVADDAAEPGRQRPGLARRKARGETRGRDRARNPEDSPDALPLERAVREQPPAP